MAGLCPRPSRRRQVYAVCGILTARDSERELGEGPDRWRYPKRPLPRSLGCRLRLRGSHSIGPSPVLPAATFPDTIRKRDAGGTGVKPSPFAYAKAKSLDHAIELLARPDGEARLLAGGQSLIATPHMRLSAPKLLVDLNAV